MISSNFLIIDSVNIIKGLFSNEKIFNSRKNKRNSKKAITIRCGDKHSKVTKNGNFYNYFGIDAEFYILDDNDQSVVVTASGLDKIMSLGKNSSILYDLLSV